MLRKQLDWKGRWLGTKGHLSPRDIFVNNKEIQGRFHFRVLLYWSYIKYTFIVPYLKKKLITLAYCKSTPLSISHSIQPVALSRLPQAVGSNHLLSYVLASPDTYCWCLSSCFDGLFTLSVGVLLLWKGKTGVATRCDGSSVKLAFEAAGYLATCI